MLRAWFKIALWKRIVLALVLGVIVGSLWGEGAVSIKWIGDLFVRLISMVVVPLVFFTLVSGGRQYPRDHILRTARGNSGTHYWREGPADHRSSERRFGDHVEDHWLGDGGCAFWCVRSHRMGLWYPGRARAARCCALGRGRVLRLFLTCVLGAWWHHALLAQVAAL